MHTVVITESERERRFTNEINKAVRRCVIGKVRHRLPPVVDEMQKAFQRALWPHLGTPLPKQTYAGGYMHTTSSGDVPLVPAHGVMM